MKKTLRYALFIAGMISLPAFAHVGYTGRNFGAFDNTYAISSISNQAVTGNYGWIDGTDADYGDAHKTLAYRFTLLSPTDVTLSFASQVSPRQRGCSRARWIDARFFALSRACACCTDRSGL